MLRVWEINIYKQYNHTLYGIFMNIYIMCGRGIYVINNVQCIYDIETFFM